MHIKKDRPGVGLDYPWRHDEDEHRQIGADRDNRPAILPRSCACCSTKGDQWRAEFRFPVERAFEFDLPTAVTTTTPAQRIEVSRVVAEATHGIVFGGLLTPLGLMRAICQYAWPRGARAGVAVIKHRLLRALRGLGVALHEIEPAAVVYPKDGPLAGYYYHSGPVVPVYFTETIRASIERAIARYQGG